MNKIQKTSILICLTILVIFISAGIVVKWPTIKTWIHILDSTPAQSAAQLGADPFRYNPPLPSYVKDLHPVYTIKADLKTNEAKITGQMTLQFDNPKTKDLRLFLYDYRWSPMVIKSIRHAEQPVSFQRRDSVISLANVGKAEKRITLKIDFETSVPRGGTRFGVRDDIWTLTNWYPMLGAMNQQGAWYEPPQRANFGDPFIYHYADYNVTFSSPEGYHWVTSWGLGKVQKNGMGRQEIAYQAKKVLNFCLVGSPLYQIETIHFEPDLTVDIASTSKEDINRIKDIAKSVFPVYIDTFGSLPYPHVSIAETNTYTHAMEYANLAIFRRNLFVDHSIDHWLPHEIAHLWWYNSVGTMEAARGWVDEGLVELSVYYYKLNRYGQQAADEVLHEYSSKREELSRRFPNGRLSKQLNQFETNEEFDWTWYAKGAMLYNNLRRQIGDEAFSEFLKRIQRNYHGSLIGPEHLDQALSQTLRGEANYFRANVAQPNRSSFRPLSIERYVDTVVNGVSFYPSVPARQRGNTVYIPLREVMEKLGYRVDWSDAQQAIRLRAGDQTLLLKERGSQVEKNGKVMKLSLPLEEISGRTMVPLPFFHDVLGYNSEYNPKTQTLKITVP